jgi:hypothetical protein
MNRSPRILIRTALALAVLIVAAGRLAAQTPPDAFLGHKVGEDRKLADYGQIVGYFQKLDQESPRLKLVEIGTSTLGKTMIMAVITAEENMARLDRYREIARRLKDSRGLAPEEARKLAREGKTILLITCSLHATEIAASQMSMELAYDLVTGKLPLNAGKALEDVIVLLVPSSNPDGNQMVVDWYRKYVGTKFEGGGMPWLYHHYAGHDNNRDWFMFNLAETKAVTKVLYHDWFPQIHIDEHQMGSNGARLFIPPFMDPPLPNVQPLLWRGVNLCGVNMAYDLQKAGFSGVVNGRSFTGWWIGACDDTSWLHNTIGLLSEMASVRVASPIYIEPTEVPKSYTERRMDFIDPWPGGWWRLRDLVDYELVLSKSLIKTAFLHKDDLLYASYLMSKTSVEKKDKGQPYAFVIPSEQADHPTTLRMLEILRFGGVEIHRAPDAFVAGGRYYPAGSFVVLTAQPYKAYAWALLEKQKYPDLREYPGGPPVPPYDNAGWTLPLQMGVRCDQIDKPFETQLVKLETVPAPALDPPGAGPEFVVLDSRTNASYAVVFALLKDKAEVWRSKEAFKGEGFSAAAGSFLIKNSPAVQKALPALLEKWKTAAYGLTGAGGIAMSAVKNPRVGLYQSWRGNMDEGWTRYVFDDLGIAFTTLHNKDFKGAKDKKVNLRAGFDVIVFASEDSEVIKTGRRGGPDAAQYARFMGSTPPEYEGGIDKEGVEALKAFVEQGGIVVTLNAASTLGFKDLGAPARNALERVERTRFFCPTSILKLDIDNTTPIGYGFDESAAAVFAGSLAMETFTPPFDWDRKVVASFPEDNVLLSGWLLGEDVIARKAAVVDTSYKKGRIILIGIRSQHRAQSHGTYKFFLNALLYPEAK